MNTPLRTPKAWLVSNNYQTETSHDHAQVLSAREQQQKNLHLLVVARNTLLVLFSALVGFTGWSVFAHTVPARYQLALLVFLSGLTFAYGILEGWKGEKEKRLASSIHLNSPASPEMAKTQVEKIREHLTGWLAVSAASDRQKERLYQHLDWLHNLIQKTKPGWNDREPTLRPHLYQQLPALITEHVPGGKHLTQEEMNLLLERLLHQEQTLLQQHWASDTLEQTTSSSTPEKEPNVSS